jgi:hypothetical protein
MRSSFVILLVIPLLLTSCFKKLEGVDELNDNIYDREYTGGPWFQITDAVEYFDIFANPKVRVEIEVPAEATPTYKPSNFYYTLDINGEDFGTVFEPMQEEGHYEIEKSVDPHPSDTYVVTMGVWIDETQESINPFTLSIQVP